MPSPSNPPPLVVDLDGTLIATDTLYESALLLIRLKPWLILAMFFWLVQGRSVLKQRIAQHVQLPAGQLPYRSEFIDWLREEKSQGRRIILATAANKQVAEAVARHLQLFDGVMASDGRINLKGINKLAAIRAQVGDRFVYAGDSNADLPIWRAADAAVVVGASARTVSQLGSAIAIEKRFPREKAGWRQWSKALRVHQWVKNVLLFTPMLTSFTFSGSMLGSMIVAFLSFSLAASATYIVNDLFDLNNDRAHPRKCLRPFASGAISIPRGGFLALALLLLGLALATWVSLAFVAMLLCYLVLTSAYTWSLKTYVLLDVIMLAALYTLRILAGAVALQLPVTPWLLAFSMFVFLSLALVKRCAELLTLRERGRESTSGRDYRASDLTVLWPLGIGAAMSAVVVFGLFISAAETRARYATPELLWLVAAVLFYWLGRLWIKTSRGEMHDDPVVYAFKDAGSRQTIAAMLLLTLAAHLLTLGP